MTLSLRGFGDLEAVIMDRLWSWSRPTTVREVVDDLRHDRKIAYTTVMTVMDNLRRKGALLREMDGRAYRYQAAQTREQHVARLLGEVLEEAGDRSAALLGFVGGLSGSEVTALREALREYDAGVRLTEN
jgi:predicted transcriptional regulator